jgi:predicted MFS family arabinose efflux permease
VALGSVSFNLARAMGPAIGGLLIAWSGSWSAFAVNAGSFAGVIGVLLLWRRSESESSGGRTFRSSLGEGLHFAFTNRDMRHILARVVLYVVPASALWSLLPLVAHDLLRWEARGYGFLVGGIGLGAVLAAGIMPRLRYQLGIGWTLCLAHGCMALALWLIALNLGGAATLATMLLAGGGWMMALTTLNSSAQMQLPRHLRARGMSCYLVAFAGAMSGGAPLWGQVAERFGLPTALAVAAVGLLATAAAGALLAIHRPEP